MPIEITAGYIAAAAADSAISLKLARVCHDTYSRTATVTASSTATGFSADSLKTGTTYDLWQPSTMNATVDFDAGSSVDVDYFAIAAHTLGTDSATIDIQHASSGAGPWTTIDSLTPTDDKPILFLFETVTDRYYRINITGSTAPSIGVVYFGEALVMERGIFGGYTPIDLATVSTLKPTISQTGQFLGRSVSRKGQQSTAEFKNLSNNFVYTSLQPFIINARKYPYFFAWRPTDKDTGIGYVWTNSDIQPANSGIRDLMDVSIPMEGLSVD